MTENKEENSKSNIDFYAFKYLKGKLTKWRIISFALFLIILFGLFKKFAPTQNDHSLNGSELDAIKKDFIAKIEINCPIMNYEGFSISNLIETLKKLEEKNEVKGLLLEINSPGGGVVSSFELYDAIISFKEKTKKPVLAFIRDVGASGAYLVSLAADHIVANNSSIVGSVGVLLEMVDLTELSSKLGVKVTSFRSGELKGLPNPFEKGTNETNLMMNGIIDDLKNQFVSVVKKHRVSISPDNLNQIQKAGIFTGKKAKEIGLIDEVGKMSDAQKWFKDKNNNQDFEIIKIETKNLKPNFLKNFLQGKVSIANLIFGFNSENQMIRKPGFYFLFDFN
jgi:protease-4